MFPAAEVVVSNLRRIRIRSNSTGAKHSSPKDPAGPRRFGNQLETPDRQRLPCGGKVPKSAFVSALSLIITPGTGGYHQHFSEAEDLHDNLPLVLSAKHRVNTLTATSVIQVESKRYMQIRNF